MFSRRNSAHKTSKEASSGRPQLTLAQFYVFIERGVRCFARPLLFVGFFAALAWIGCFAKLYPYAHLLALAMFFVLFFDALGNAAAKWTWPSASDAKRRVEEVSGLRHRPLDTLGDHPVGTNTETHDIWQRHIERTRAEVKNLRWPRMKLDLAKHDRYRLRYVLAGLLTIGLVMGWGALGGRLIAAINPALGKLPISTVTIDAWITPPEYTHLPPIMIATPAGDRFQDQVINIPEGSVLHAHLAEKDGDAPVLKANGQSTEFSAVDGKDFDVTQTLTGGDSIAIKRGWMVLSSWKVRVLPDTAPQVSFTENPSASERKDVRIVYDAKDDYGITSVTLRVSPRQSLPGISGDAVEYQLASLDQKDLKRVDFKDLTAEPWAGLMVDMQLIATDAKGHKSETGKTPFTLPERIFFHPVARALIDERKKLLQNIFDAQVRSETANLMAGLAKEPKSFGGDAVTMMALRAGAVRLVLDHDAEAALTVKDILWKTATRIEEGTMGVAEQNLQRAQQELADALDHNASEKQVQALIDRLHQALAQYLAQLSTRVAAQPSAAEDLGQVLGTRTNTLTPQDLERMLNQMKNFSATGNREEAREELQRLQQILQNLQTHQQAMNADQKAALQLLKDMQALTKDQQKLLDDTFQISQNKDQKDQRDAEKLAGKQAALKDRLQKVMQKVQGIKDLKQSADAMEQAEKKLRAAATGDAVQHQNEALKDLQTAQQAMQKSFQQSMFGLPTGGAGGNDPFGREGGSGLSNHADVHVPEHFKAGQVREILDEIQRRASDNGRPKAERDYIERLLQNF